MDTARLFVSLPIETSVVTSLHEEFSRLDLPWKKLKPVDPKILHLSLKFIGNIRVDKIPNVIEALDNVKGLQDFVELSMTKTAIIDEHNPRLLTIEFEPSEIISQLASDIDTALADAKITYKEARKYWPHLTMARIKSKVTLDELRPFLSLKADYKFTSSYFTLEESQLSSKGPKYFTLQTFNL